MKKHCLRDFFLKKARTAFTALSRGRRSKRDQRHPPSPSVQPCPGGATRTARRSEPSPDPWTHPSANRGLRAEPHHETMARGQWFLALEGWPPQGPERDSPQKSVRKAGLDARGCFRPSSLGVSQESAPVGRRRMRARLPVALSPAPDARDSKNHATSPQPAQAGAMDALASAPQRQGCRASMAAGPHAPRPLWTPSNWTSDQPVAPRSSRGPDLRGNPPGARCAKRGEKSRHGPH